MMMSTSFSNAPTGRPSSYAVLVSLSSTLLILTPRCLAGIRAAEYKVSMLWARDLALDASYHSRNREAYLVGRWPRGRPQYWAPLQEILDISTSGSIRIIPAYSVPGMCVVLLRLPITSRVSYALKADRPASAPGRPVKRRIKRLPNYIHHG